MTRPARLVLIVAIPVLVSAAYFFGARRTSNAPRTGDGATADRLLVALACGRGDTQACERNLAGDRERCERNDTQGCVLLGIAYQGGRDVPRDDTAAARWFAVACDGNDANGCWYAGMAYEQGRGVEQDPARARALYQRGCDLGGDVNACISLGVAMQHGRGGPADRAGAITAFRRGCAMRSGQSACEYASRVGDAGL